MSDSDRKNLPAFPPPAPRWLSPVLLAVMTVVILGCYFPVLSGRFLNWDDDRNFIHNPSFRGLGGEQLRWAWSTYHLGVWQPLAWFLLEIQYRLFEMRPAGYHATSLLFHCLNAALLYAVCVELLRQALTAPAASSYMRLASAAGVLVFALHPLRVESVAWISCQPYLPAAFFYLLAMYAYLRAHSTASRRIGPAAATALAFVFYAFAVGFKAVAISLPAVLLVLDVWPLGRWGRGGRERRRLFLEKVPFLVVAACASAWAIQAKDYSASRAPLHEFDFSARAAQAAAGVWFYWLKTVIPVDLSAYYRLPPDLTLATPRFAFAAAAVLGLGAVLWLARRRFPAALVVWAVYLLTLLPNLGLIQISQQLAADRYSYLAMIGPTALLSAGLYAACVRVARGMALRRAAVPVAILFVCIALGHLTGRRIKTWKDSETLWRATIALDADCAVSHCNLGEALAAQGRYAESSSHLSRAIDLDTQFSFAYSNLGAVLCQARRFDDAIACGLKALETPPALQGRDLARTHAMLGQAYAGLRRDAEAWRHTRAAQRLGLEEADKMIEYLSGVSPEPARGEGG
jgi:tetratricopeptide (TPR) repeat protein